MSRLLIVANVPSPNTQQLIDALLLGARHPDVTGVTVDHIAPLRAGAEDVQGCDAIILGTTENFGYMSGALKDFFDRIYYPCLEHTEGLPYGLLIRAGQDGVGARTAVERIVTGLKWRAVQPPLVLRGEFDTTFLGRCERLGLTMAAGLEAGIF